MTVRPCLQALAFALLFLSPTARAETIPLERWLLPRAIADRVEGSGVECRDRQATGGQNYTANIGALQVHVSSWFWVRAGVGTAHILPLPYESPIDGYAAGAGGTWVLGRVHGFLIVIDLNAVSARTDSATFMDGSLLVRVRSP